MQSEMDFSTLKSEIEAHKSLLSYQWLSIAMRYFGVAEYSGNKNSNPVISQFFATSNKKTFKTGSLSLPEISTQTKFPIGPMLGVDLDDERLCKDDYLLGPDCFDDSKRSWCSAFVKHVMTRSGYNAKETTNDTARSWEKWGYTMPIGAELFGAIAVFQRFDRENEHAGHVGFYVGKKGDKYLVLGGNQGGDNTNPGSVCVRLFPKNRLLSFRWPEQVLSKNRYESLEIAFV